MLNILPDCAVNGNLLITSDTERPKILINV